MVVKVLQQVDRHLNKCAEARRRGLWNVVLTKASAAMESGADMSPQVNKTSILVLTLCNLNNNHIYFKNCS